VQAGCVTGRGARCGDPGTALYCGLRRAELVALDVEDFDRDSGKLVVRAGKGRKQRTVYVQGGALQALLIT